MLISLKIKNFRSIRDEVTIDLQVSSRFGRKDLPANFVNYNNANLLKSLILYGRNASGKSNILKAFRAIQFLVQESRELKHEERIPLYEPFLFDKTFKDNPVEIGVVFIAESIKYEYQIKYNINEIVFESLFCYPKGVPSKLYVREKNEFSFGEYFKGEKKNIQEELLGNQLFLSKSATTNIPYLKEAFLFFSNSIIYSRIQEIAYYRRFGRLFSEKILDDKIIMSNMKKLLKATDTNILDFTINKNEPEEFKFPESIPDTVKTDVIKRYEYEIKTKHLFFDKGNHIGEEYLDFDEESLGTKKLLYAGRLVLSALYNGGVVIIDELDKSLHPLLSKMLIGLFHSVKNNPKNAQLIIATHDTALLDNEIFRRDQVYITDKEYEGNTILYKLSDIKGVRQNLPFDKWYLSGRFRGIPITSDIELDFE